MLNDTDIISSLQDNATLCVFLDYVQWRKCQPIYKDDPINKLFHYCTRAATSSRKFKSVQINLGDHSLDKAYQHKLLDIILQLNSKPVMRIEFCTQFVLCC